MATETEKQTAVELDPFDTWLVFDPANPLNWIVDKDGEYVGVDYPTPPFTPGEDDEF